MSDLALAKDFPPADERMWRELAETALKGAPLERLTSRSLDGIEIRPVYPQTAHGPAIGVKAGWQVLGRVDHPDTEAAAEIARSEIEGGAAGLLLVFADAGGGACLGEGAEIGRLLKGLDMSSMALHAEAGREGAPVLAALLAAASDFGPARLVVRFGLADALLAFRLGERDWTAEAVRMLRDVEGDEDARLFCADGRMAHNAGGSEAQELAVMLADLVAQLRLLEGEGTSAADAAARMSIALAADTDQFATMAKLRAARLLAARVLQACGVDRGRLPLHVETSRRMLSRRDPWVNMLRTTAAVAAAGLAGAETMSALPHTAAIGVADLAARRLARNTQLILLQESGLGRVGDPAAGSGYVEALTEAYCAKAWEVFQGIEAQGGLVAALQAGTVQQDIAATLAKRRADIRTRRQPLTGTSEFPWLEEPEARLHPKGDRPLPHVRPAEGVAPLPPVHLGEEFERLRDLSDRIEAQSGQRPSVFLAALGRLAEHSTRTGWARAAFAAGGIDAVAGPDEAAPEAIAASFRDSSCRIACLCGTDEAYGEQGAAVAAALKEAGCERVFLAGRPRDLADVLTKSGVDAFLHAGCDMIEALEEAYEALGEAGAATKDLAK